MALVIPIGTGIAQADVTVVAGVAQTVKLVPPPNLQLTNNMFIDLYYQTDGTSDYRLAGEVNYLNNAFVIVGAGTFRFIRRGDSEACGLSVI